MNRAEKKVRVGMLNTSINGRFNLMHPTCVVDIFVHTKKKTFVPRLRAPESGPYDIQ